MKTNDYVKFITQTLVERLEQSPEERKKQKEEKIKEPLLYKWFGVLPYAIKEGVKRILPGKKSLFRR
jgi:hypothetical protein